LELFIGGGGIRGIISENQSHEKIFTLELEKIEIEYKESGDARI